MFVKVITPPTIEAIQLDQARSWLRIDVPGFSGDSGQDDAIWSAIRAAREHCEREIDYCLCAQTLVAAAARFSDFSCTPQVLDHASIYSPWWVEGGAYRGFGGLRLPRGPVRSIDSIKYIDQTGVDVTVDPATYRLSLDGRVSLTGGATAWPSARYEHESVRIQFVAGYQVPGDRATTPPLSVETIGEDVVMAMRLLIGHYFVNRSAVVNSANSQALSLGVGDLLRNNRSSIGI